MGLFDNLITEVSADRKFTPKDVREAYASALYCCANADRDINDEELISLDNLFSNISVFEGYDDAEYLVLAEKNAGSYTPLQMLQGSFSYINEQTRAKLFCYCCDIFLADGTITAEEKQTLEKIAEISGIDEETAKKIVEVALIRNLKDQ